MRRHRRPLALVLCDLDNFKAFNDLYGHQAGDDCLARIAVALQACCRRPADMAARYGGEEFALVLPETDLAGAVRIAEAAREAVSRLQIAHARDRQARGNIGSVMTLSGGVAVLDGHGNGSLDSLVGAADAALFEAKRQGRDRIVSSKREFAGL
jgi:diguanylate cyclase (GGDEF)-like protein